jgi:hypothetical protein
VNKPTTDDDGEIHPNALVTVNLYVPGSSPDIVVLDPVPAVIVPPGVFINVHVPVAGRPLRTTLPVATFNDGCVMAPITGAVGVVGWALITALPDADEVHPEVLVTLKVYMPAETPEIVVFAPVPVLVVLPGVLVNVQVPVAGSPFKTTLPVATLQVGSVIDPSAGAAGVEGCALMTILADVVEIHAEAFVTV